MSRTINPNVAVWVKYTKARSGTPANIQFFTTATGKTLWTPAALAYNSQTSYYFGAYNSTDYYNWHAFTFWPKDSSDQILSNVVESFIYGATNGRASFQSTTYIENVNVWPGTPPRGMPNGPNFCIVNNNKTADEGYVGMQMTLLSSRGYFTSADPKIPLKPNT